jgi:conjugative transfer region protein (TIGR03750 family)
MTGYPQNPRQAPQDGLNDGLVVFLPHRLNRHPVVIRGLTADELWACAGLSGVAGFLTGLAVAWLTQSIAMVPTLVVVGIGIGVFWGGGFLRRKKRGRPDTWLYRQLQWRLALRYPSLAAQVGGRQIITYAGWWTTRREWPSTSIRRGAA